MVWLASITSGTASSPFMDSRKIIIGRRANRTHDEKRHDQLPGRGKFSHPGAPVGLQSLPTLLRQFTAAAHIPTQAGTGPDRPPQKVAGRSSDVAIRALTRVPTV